MRTKIINAVTLVFLAFLCVLFLAVYLPKMFGMSVYYVETESMYPTLKVGCAVIDKKVLFEDIKVNDLITFTDESNKKFCTHRVVDVNLSDESFVTKGDNNTIRDPYSTPYKYVQGKVVFKIPFVGFIFRALDTSAARITVVSVCIVAFAVEIEIYRKNRKEGGNDD